MPIAAGPGRNVDAIGYSMDDVRYRRWRDSRCDIPITIFRRSRRTAWSGRWQDPCSPVLNLCKW